MPENKDMPPQIVAIYQKDMETGLEGLAQVKLGQSEHQVNIDVNKLYHHETIHLQTKK